MRHLPASSIGPEYRTVWHYPTDGTWTFITDRRPEHTYARYFAPGDSANRARHARLANRAMIHPRYSDDDRIVTRIPPITLRSNGFRRVANVVAAALLRAGPSV